MILPEMGLSAQNKLKSARVLVIGAGGIGSSVLLYLSGLGIGTIGIVDSDVVERTNLHRQVLHCADSVGMKKVDSAKQRITALNDFVNVETHPVRIVPHNAQELVSKYDIVIDGSDNAMTRYLVNDACVLEGKVLISGAAVKWDAQLTVYNQDDGPCYRCLYPSCPKASQMMSCSDNGVIGMVPGMIGILLATECLKILTGNGESMKKRLLTYDALTCKFRNFKIRGRQKNCIVCGESPTLVDVKKYDYLEFVGLNCKTGIEFDGDQIEWPQLLSEFDKENDIMIDVRPKEQHDLVNFTDNLDQCYFLPFKKMKDMAREEIEESLDIKDKKKTVVFVFCRRGNASRRAVNYLNSLGFEGCCDVKGGLVDYQQLVDEDIPTLV